MAVKGPQANIGGGGRLDFAVAMIARKAGQAANDERCAA